MVQHERQTDDGRFPVVVIGAGLAGLAAAAHLAERGMPPLLLEADIAWAGGRLSGGESEQFTHNGRAWSFRPDHGVHAVWGGYVNLRALLERFTDTRLIASPGEEWINRWGREVRRLEAGNAVRSRWLLAPFHYLNLLFHPHIWATITPLDFLSLPGVLVSLLLAVGLDPMAEERPMDGLTMREFFRGWTPNLRATFTGLATNLLAAPPETISLTGLIAALRFYTLLRRDAWAMHYFPADSHTSLIQPLLDAVQQRGGSVRQGITATRLERLVDGWRVVVHDAARQGERSLWADHVVLALNAPGAQRLLCSSPDTAAAARRMHFPDGLQTVVVRLWFDHPAGEETPGGMLTGDFAPDNFFWLHRLYDDYAVWHQETGGCVIELHFYAGPGILSQPDRSLLVLAVTEVQRAFPAVRGHFVHGTVRRNSGVHTRFRVPGPDTLAVRTPFPRLYACGDWVRGDTPSLWMERAVTTGIYAANEVLHSAGQQPFPVLAPPRAEWSARALAAGLGGVRMAMRPLVGWWRQRRRHASGSQNDSPPRAM